MTNPYLASGVLEALREEGMFPASDEQETTARLYAFMNREQTTYLTRLLLSAREGYLEGRKDQTVTSGILSYRIPPQAVGARLKAVVVVQNDVEVPLSQGQDFSIQGNSVVFQCAPSFGSFRFVYYRRANKIVADEEAGEVESFDAGAKTVVLVEVPEEWTDTQDYDFIQGQPHFDSIGLEQEASIDVLTRTLTFTEDLPTDLAVGDFLALTGQTPIIQFPLECHYLLALRSCFKVLRSLGDPKAEAVKKDLEDTRADVLSLIQVRVDGDSPVLINYDAPGWGAGGFRRRSRF